jgi:hypothetical protein
MGEEVVVEQDSFFFFRRTGSNNPDNSKGERFIVEKNLPREAGELVSFRWRSQGIVGNFFVCFLSFWFRKESIRINKISKRKKWSYKRMKRSFWSDSMAFADSSWTSGEGMSIRFMTGTGTSSAKMKH